MSWKSQVKYIPVSLNEWVFETSELVVQSLKVCTTEGTSMHVLGGRRS